MKKIYYTMLIALVSMTMAMTSCRDWDSPYYLEDIVGSWVSYYGRDYMGDYDLVGYDVVRYDFYRDHTGRYTYYSYYGLDYVDFEWNTSGDRLFIYYYDGTSDYLFYGFDRNGDLILGLDSRFNEFTAYRPAGMYMYLDAAKENSSVAGKKMTSKEVKKMDGAAASTTSRAVKKRTEVKE